MDGKMKILFVNNNMEIGGIQQALLNLLKEIHSEYEITLFLFSAHGELLKEVPKDVNIVEAGFPLRLLGVSQRYAREHFSVFRDIERGALAGICRLLGNKYVIKTLVARQKAPMGFDWAISYMQCTSMKKFYGGCNEMALKIPDAKKGAFVHCDFCNYGGNSSYNRSVYMKFDRVAAVSMGCLRSFLTAIPQLEKKAVCVYNCHDLDTIRRIAEENTAVYDDNYFNMVTVSRLGTEKGQMRVPAILERLNTEGLKIKWHVVGDGANYERLMAECAERGLEKAVTLYGNQENPYKYIKNADLLIAPSYHEAAPMVYLEAACLGVPVLTTLTTSSVELVENAGIGIVCENSDSAIENTLRDIVSGKIKMKPFDAEKITDLDAVNGFKRAFEIDIISD